jgi:hypothetical protein
MKQPATTTDAEELHENKISVSAPDIDPTTVSCYGVQRSTMNKCPSRRRLWLPKKWGGSKQVLVPQNNGQVIVDALLNSLVTIDRSSGTSSTSGSLTNENTFRSNGNCDDSLDESNSPSLHHLKEKVDDEQEVSKTMPTPVSISEVQDSFLSAPDIITPTTPTKIALESREFSVHTSTSSHEKMYQVVDLDLAQECASRGIRDDHSAHSLDTISTITMDPVIRCHRSSPDDYVKKRTSNSSSCKCQQDYHKMKRLPLLQSFGTSSLDYELSIWANATFDHGQSFPAPRNVCVQQPKPRPDDQSAGVLTGNIVTYITTNEAAKNSAGIDTSETEITPLYVSISPKKLSSAINQNKVRKSNRRKLRSYQCEPVLSPVADSQFVEI